VRGNPFPQRKLRLYGLMWYPFVFNNRTIEPNFPDAVRVSM
jgi:hypothetical protein